MEKTAILCKLPEYESYHDISPYIQITNGVRVCSFIKVNIQLMMYIRSFTCNHLIMNLSDLFTLGRHIPMFSESAQVTNCDQTPHDREKMQVSHAWRDMLHDHGMCEVLY